MPLPMGHIFFLCCPCMGEINKGYNILGTYFFFCEAFVWGSETSLRDTFFFCEVLVGDIFSKSIFCISASRTLRALAGLWLALACALLG